MENARARFDALEFDAPLSNGFWHGEAGHRRIAAQAPLAVQATLASARASLGQGPIDEAARLLDRARKLMDSEDAAEGMRSFVERREAKFTGR